MRSTRASTRNRISTAEIFYSLMPHASVERPEPEQDESLNDITQESRKRSRENECDQSGQECRPKKRAVEKIHVSPPASKKWREHSQSRHTRFEEEEEEELEEQPSKERNDVLRQPYITDDVSEENFESIVQRQDPEETPPSPMRVAESDGSQLSDSEGSRGSPSSDESYVLSSASQSSQNHNKISKSALPTRQKLKFCLDCGKSFKSQRSVVRHQLVHGHGDVQGCKKCTICSQKFTGLRQLKFHLSTKHLGIKPYKCDLCGKSYGNEKSYINHRHRCKETKSSFNTEEQSEEEPIFQVRSKRARELVPFRCLKCGRYYKLIRTLAKHLKTKHAETESRSRQVQEKTAASTLFKCRQCFKVYPTEEKLNRHVHQPRKLNLYFPVKSKTGLGIIPL